MTHTINIDYGTLYTIVARSLSIIGKRSTDDQGNLLFRDITLGSREKGLIFDYFSNAFAELCSELERFLTATVENHTGLVTVIYTRWWTDQAASGFTSQIRSNGEYLYNYANDVLYVSSLSFPFSSVTPATNTLFVYHGTYYRWNSGLTELTAEQTAALTDQEKDAATVLTYYDTNPSTVSETRPDIYLYYNSGMYKSERSASFSEESITADTGLVDPLGRTYRRDGNVLTEVPMGLDDSVTLTVEMPDNWNPALQQALQQAVIGYCVAYALYSWFTITAPRISDKYLGDMQRCLASVIRLANDKKAPANATDIMSTSTNVT